MEPTSVSNEALTCIQYENGDQIMTNVDHVRIAARSKTKILKTAQGIAIKLVGRRTFPQDRIDRLFAPTLNSLKGTRGVIIAS